MERIKKIKWMTGIGWLFVIYCLCVGFSFAAPYLGDFPEDQAIYYLWNSCDSDGASITRATDGTISIYKDNSDALTYDTTQVTHDVTDTEDFDSLTGVHMIVVGGTNSWFETGHDYVAVLSAATIDGQTVNAALFSWSYENRTSNDAKTRVELALPAAAPDAAGGLPISDAGALDLDIALQKGMFADGKIYLDPGGTNSTAWPYGSAPYPTTTIANGKTIADAIGVDYFVCHGDLTMSAAMENYIFTGHGHMEIAHRINIDSQSVEHSVIKDLVIQGTMTNATGVLNTTRFVNCDLWALAGIHAIASDGALAGALSILDGGIFIANGMDCGALAACTLTLQAPAVCLMTNMKGVLTIAGMDGGTASISMAPGMTLTLDNTNTGGTLTISGDSAGLTDNSNGTTVTVVKPVVNTVQVGGTNQTANDIGGDVNTILIDTEAQDSATELRTLLTGADTPVAKDSTPLTAAETEAEVEDALQAMNLDHLVKLAVDTNWATTVHLDSVIGHIADDGTSATFDRTADSLEDLRDQGDSAWITATGFSTLTTSDNIGINWGDVSNPTTTVGLTNTTVGIVTTNSDMRGTDGANTTVPDAAGTAPTKAEIVDEWESQANTDPTGFKVNVMEVNGTAQTANDNGADINTLITQVGTAGDGLTEAGGDGDHLTEAGATGDHLTAINLPNQTMDITGNITGNLSGSVGSVTGAVGSVAGNVDGNVSGSVASCAAATVSAIGDNVITDASMAADVDTLVNDEVAAALTTYDPPTDTEMLAAHTTTDALINGIDDNAWDDGTRTLTAFDEDDMTLDVDGTQFGLFTAALATSIGNIETDTGTTIIADLLTMKQTAAGAYDRDTDSLEAIRDRGDAAWTTGAGGSPPTTLQNTTIATLASQTSFTLTAGSADDDAYNDCVAVVEDSITSTQKCVGRILGYTGATKTVTLEADPGVFTMAIGDTIDIIAVEKTWAAATKALTDKSNFNLAADQSGVTIGTCTTNTDMRGTDNAALAATALSSATWTAARAGYIDELAAANIPTDLATIEAVVDSILADTGTDGVKVSSLSASAVDLIIDEIIEGTLTMRQIFRILLAKNTGLTEGSGTATIKFRDLADSKYRITGTITDGNRVSVTLDGS